MCYLLELSLYDTGIRVYAVDLQARRVVSSLRQKTADEYQCKSRFPEYLAPGRFDIWEGLYQIFHVALSYAIYAHHVALTRSFTACHAVNPFSCERGYDRA